jgi:hypothetical protein
MKWAGDTACMGRNSNSCPSTGAGRSIFLSAKEKIKSQQPLSLLPLPSSPTAFWDCNEINALSCVLCYIFTSLALSMTLYTKYCLSNDKVERICHFLAPGRTAIKEVAQFILLSL